MSAGLGAFSAPRRNFGSILDDPPLPPNCLDTATAAPPSPPPPLLKPAPPEGPAPPKPQQRRTVAIAVDEAAPDGSPRLSPNTQALIGSLRTILDKGQETVLAFVADRLQDVQTEAQEHLGQAIASAAERRGCAGIVKQILEETRGTGVAAASASAPRAPPLTFAIPAEPWLASASATRAALAPSVTSADLGAQAAKRRTRFSADAVPRPRLGDARRQTLGVGFADQSTEPLSSAVFGDCSMKEMSLYQVDEQGAEQWEKDLDEVDGNEVDRRSRSSACSSSASAASDSPPRKKRGHRRESVRMLVEAELGERRESAKLESRQLLRGQTLSRLQTLDGTDIEEDEEGRHREKVQAKGTGKVFADASEMKENVRRAIQKAEYHITDLYKTEGFCQALARDLRFEYFTLVVIALNAIWIAIDADFNHSAVLYQAEPHFQVMDHFFCTYFLVEWLIKFGAFREKRTGLRDRGFLVDTVLMVFMVLETWLMTFVIFLWVGRAAPDMSVYSFLRLFRLFRLTRMARMLRLLRAFPELMVLIKGVITAVRSVSFTLCLLASVIYVFAVTLTQVTSGSQFGDTYFRNVPDSAFSLLVHATLPDLSHFITEAMDEHVAYCAILMVYILLAFLTIMNMIVGVIVEVVSVVAAVENEEMTVKFVRSRLLTVFNAVEDGNEEATMHVSKVGEDAIITQEEFELYMTKPETVRAIQEVGVDPVGLVDLADLIFLHGPITFGKFMEVVLQLRGSNQATVKDIVDLRKVIMTEFDTLDSDRIFLGLSVIQTEVEKLNRKVAAMGEQTADAIKASRHCQDQNVENHCDHHDSDDNNHDDDDIHDNNNHNDNNRDDHQLHRANARSELSEDMPSSIPYSPEPCKAESVEHGQDAHNSFNGSLLPPPASGLLLGGRKPVLPPSPFQGEDLPFFRRHAVK